MRDEHADACKCQSCSDKVVYLNEKQRRTIDLALRDSVRILDKGYLEFHSRQVRLDAMFARISATR